MSQDAFGPNLRRLRVQRQISIEQIVEATKVSAAWFHGLERNDFSLWPTGVCARAFVRQYAEAIGVDADSTVDEFCRWFPQGDRRSERTVREHAEIVGHDNLDWQDVPPADQDDRRGAARTSHASVQSARQSPIATWFLRLWRVLGRA
jgi:transcriptional regulator with XRE-family HTH domain